MKLTIRRERAEWTKHRLAKWLFATLLLLIPAVVFFNMGEYGATIAFVVAFVLLYITLASRISPKKKKEK